jgi:hypothetical protein
VKNDSGAYVLIFLLWAATAAFSIFVLRKYPANQVRTSGGRIARTIVITFGLLPCFGLSWMACIGGFIAFRLLEGRAASLEVKDLPASFGPAKLDAPRSSPRSSANPFMPTGDGASPATEADSSRQTEGAEGTNDKGPGKPANNPFL